MKVTRKCQICGNDLITTEWRIKDNRGKFCSMICYRKSRVGKKIYRKICGHEIISCKKCGKEFKDFKSNHKIFCSKKCMHSCEEVNKRRAESAKRSRKGSIRAICIICGKSLTKFRCEVKAIRLKGLTCSKECGYKKISMLLSGDKSPIWKGGIPNCSDCGKKISYGNRKCHKCRGKEFSGEKSWAWKGGITPLNIQIRGCETMKSWKKCVFERDNWTCVVCNERGGKLNADHIKSFALIMKENKISSMQNALDCKELWKLSNGRTLCVPCHRKSENYGHKTTKILNKMS